MSSKMFALSRDVLHVSRGVNYPLGFSRSIESVSLYVPLGRQSLSPSPHLQNQGWGQSEVDSSQTPMTDGTRGQPCSATADFARTEWGLQAATSPDSPKDIGNPHF